MTTGYFTVDPIKKISPCQTFVAYLGGSAFQTVVDNPITAYRQLLQQYAKSTDGTIVSPASARKETLRMFRANPVSVSLSGLGPRLVGVGFKRIPKFGFLLGYSYLTQEGRPGLMAATTASILSAPFINPIRMIEKQQRAYYRETGATKPILEIVQESRRKHFRPLFRGTIPLMGHSLASATTGLVGQPQLESYIRTQLQERGAFSHAFVTNLVASAAVSPIYVMMTNPLSRLEVIMQTTSIHGNRITLRAALKEVSADVVQNGLSGMFRGQGIGIAKAIVSLSMFHQGRMWCTDFFKRQNA